MIALYDPAQHHVLAYRYGGLDSGMVGSNLYVRALWLRGYPTQARAQSAKALSLAQQLAHPYTVARMLYYDTFLGQPEGRLAALEEALTLMEQTGGRYYDAELHRQRGELLLLREAKSPTAQGSRDQ